MKEYLDERVTKQRKWYESKANESKKIFISYQTVIIVLGALIPVIVAFESVSSILEKYGGPITALISAIIVIYAGLDKLMQPQPNWFNYRANEESIKKEEWFYKYKAGPYKGIKEEIAKILFVERIEGIISSDIARTTNIIEEKEDDTSGTILDDNPNPNDSVEKEKEKEKDNT